MSTKFIDCCKRISFVLVLCLLTSLCFSQTTIGTYSNGNYTLNLNSDAKTLIWERIKDSSGYNGVLTNVYIDDDAPDKEEGYPYLAFVAFDESEQISHSLYFKLRKSISENVTTYTLVEARADDDLDGGTCTGAPCNQCKGHRSWFLGPIKSCTCEQNPPQENQKCNHSTTDSLPWWWGIVTLIMTLV